MSSFSVDSLVVAVGIIGNVTSLLVFASPIKTFCGVVKKKSTEDEEGAPYIATLLCTSLWCFYGVLNPGGFLVATVNGAGAIFHCFYLLLFLIYSPQHNKVKTAKLVGILNVGFVGAVISVTLLALRHRTIQLTVLGMLCSGLTILMYASPLVAMKKVIKTKSVECMPLLLSFFMFLNAAVWTFYSLLVKDFYVGRRRRNPNEGETFIQKPGATFWTLFLFILLFNQVIYKKQKSHQKRIPNFIGLILGSAHLTVYMVYKERWSECAKGITVAGMGKRNMISAMEMGEFDIIIEDGKVYYIEDVKVTEKALKRAQSLPKKPTLNCQNNIRRRLNKALSFESTLDWAQVNLSL